MKHFNLSSFFKGIEQKPPLSIKTEVETKPEPKSKRGRGTGRGKAKEKTKEKEVTIKPLPPPKKHKKHIPIALREQVWIKQMGRVFQGKCSTTWCQNIITVFDFQSGHNIPESKGGPTTLENLFPLCSRCNLSMGNDYTIDEWSKVFEPPVKIVTSPVNTAPVVDVVLSKKWFCCF
jgi:hypothetical protein